jgi:Cu+-exporting ATPase
MVGFDAAYVPAKPAPRKRAAAMRSSFAIEGMTCASCVATVQNVLEAVEGVKEATVSLLQHEAKVVFDPTKTSAEAIAESVETVGFGAEVKETAPVADASGAAAGPVSNEETWARPIVVVVGGGTAVSGSGSGDARLAAMDVLGSIATVEAAPAPAEGEADEEGRMLGGGEQELVINGKPGTTGSGWLRSRHVLAMLRAAGLHVRLPDGMSEEADTVKVSAAAAAAADVLRWRRRLFLAAVPTVIIFIVSMILGHIFPDAIPVLNDDAGGVYGLSWRALILWVLSTPVVFGVGWPFISNAYKRLRGGCTMGMDFLIVTGSLTAYVFSVMEISVAIAAGASDRAEKPTEFFEASAAIVTLVVFGKFLESAAKGRTADALTSLVELQPSQAMVLEPKVLATATRSALAGAGHPAASSDDDGDKDDLGVLHADNQGGVELASPSPKPTGAAAAASAGSASGVAAPALRVRVDAEAVAAGSVSADAAAMGVVSATSFPGCVVTSLKTEQVETGDIIRVAPGARVPVDGVVVAGGSIVDESAMTGEAMPVRKAIGDEALAATVNVGKSVMLIRATRVGRDTAIAHVISLVEDAQMSSAPVQALADRVSGVFAPVVLVFALLTAVGWGVAVALNAVPEDWIPPALGHFGFCLRFGLAVVVIACPCALGLATPTAVMVGTGVAARLGILIKGGQPLETLQGIKAIMFDKTGTLTEGKPQLMAVVVTDPSLSPPLGDDSNHSDAAKPAAMAPAREAAFSGGTGGSAHHDGAASSALGSASTPAGADSAWSAGASLADQFREYLRLAAVVEAGSDHPLAQAIVVAAKKTLGEEELGLEAVGFEEEAGHGVKAVVDGREVCVGTRRWMTQHGIELTNRVEREKAILEMMGHTAVLVGVDNEIRAVLALADKVKDEALATVAQLQAMGVSVHILTGDNKRAAAAVARELGIPESQVIAEVLPADKIAAVKALQERGISVAMVGDGINDAPALAQADVGIAIGAGTQVAIDAGDVVLVKSDLTDVVTAIDLSRAVLRRIWLNYFFSMGYNVLGIPVAAGLFYPIVHVALPPEVAALAMAMSSVCVVLSSLMLRFYRSPAEVIAQAGAKTTESGLTARKRRAAGGAYASLHDSVADTSNRSMIDGMMPDDMAVGFGTNAATSLTSVQAASPSAASIVHPACTCACSDCTAKLRFHVSGDSKAAATRLAKAVVNAHRSVHGPSASCKCACVCNEPRSPPVAEPKAAVQHE